MFPAFYRTKDVQQSPIRHAEGDVFVHTLMVLDAVKDKISPSEKKFKPLVDKHDLILIIFAAMYHDTGKRERNLLSTEENKIDHVRESIKHAKNDLAKYLSEEDLDIVVEMIQKHETIHGDQLSYRVNKLFKLFSLRKNLESGLLLLKFSESDLLGRKIAEGHEDIWDKNMAILDRNVEIYEILSNIEDQGQSFPIQHVSADILEKIKKLVNF